MMADNRGYQIHFDIETLTGEHHEGFIEIPNFELDKDSVNNSGYTLQRFKHISNSNNNLIYYKQRLAYNYYDVSIDEPFYYLTDESSILFKSIKSIHIKNIFDSDINTGIRNKITLKDTVWMNTEPVDKMTTVNSHCVFRILIHEKNKGLEKLLKKLNALDISEGESIYDEKHSQLLEKLNGYKIIVIANCTD
jgi:hypothetical protein